jgi:hypothetical protein
MAELAKGLNKLLDSYVGLNTSAVARDFSFVNDPKVRSIVQRDYGELVLRSFPDRAWKSTVILAGSILEAVLHDRLTKDAATIAKAMAASSAPKYKGSVKDITKHDYENEWKLVDLINVASELKILPDKNKVAIDIVLREYRNFVHPRVEVQQGVSITEGHATAAKGMLEVVLDELK